MELKQLSYFQQVAMDGSFSKAARQLYVSQQALSKSIQNLEGELHAPLFKRAHTGLALTELGAAVLRECQGIGSHVRNITCLADDVDTRKVTVRVAFPEVTLGANSDFTLEEVLGFEHLHRHMNLDITEEPSDKCLELLDQRAVELAVVIGPVDFSRYQCRKLIDEDALPVLSADDPLAASDSVTLRDLQDKTFFIPRGCTASMRNVCDAFYAAGLECPPQDRFLFPNCSPSVLLEYIYNGRGVALMPRTHANLIDESRAKVLELEAAHFTISRCVVNSRAVALSAEAAAFREYLVALGAKARKRCATASE